MDLIQRLAPSPALVTVLGESGTGKELVARALHAAASLSPGQLAQCMRKTCPRAVPLVGGAYIWGGKVYRR